MRWREIGASRRAIRERLTRLQHRRAHRRTFHRFRRAHAVAAYLGLTPGEHSSSERQQRTGITKAGPQAVRRALIQAAWSALRTAPDDAMVRWASQIAQRRGRFVAVVALARKMAGVLFAMWRDGTTYRATAMPAQP